MILKRYNQFINEAKKDRFPLSLEKANLYFQPLFDDCTVHEKEINVGYINYTLIFDEDRINMSDIEKELENISINMNIDNHPVKMIYRFLPVVDTENQHYSYKKPKALVVFIVNKQDELKGMTDYKVIEESNTYIDQTTPSKEEILDYFQIVKDDTINFKAYYIANYRKTKGYLNLPIYTELNDEYDVIGYLIKAEYEGFRDHEELRKEILHCFDNIKLDYPKCNSGIKVERAYTEKEKVEIKVYFKQYV